MMSFLTRIYPFKQSRHWLRDGFFYGLVIWAILYFLQPFGFCLYQGNKCLAAALFGIRVLCSLFSFGIEVFSPDCQSLAHLA